MRFYKLHVKKLNEFMQQNLNTNIYKSALL